VQNGCLLREHKDRLANANFASVPQKRHNGPNGPTGFKKFKNKLFVANKFVQKHSSFEIFAL